MNTKILTLLGAAAFLTGCSSMYKATATPDDIYYTQPAAAKTATDAGYDKYENYQASNEDQYLRMKVQNNSLWGTIDDYSYWNNSQYDFGYSCSASRMMLYSPLYYQTFTGYAWGLYGGGFGFGYNWGSWYSPYQTVVLYKSPSVYFGNTNKSTLTAYHNLQYNNTNSSKYFAGSQGTGVYTTRGGNGNQNSGYTTRTPSGSYVPARSFSAGSASGSAGGRSGGFSSAGSSAGGARVGRH